MKISRAIIIAMCAFVLTACGSAPVDPNAPPLTEQEKQAINLQRTIDISLATVRGANIYISIKSDDWPEDRVQKYRDIVAIAKSAIHTMQALLDEGDIQSAESQRIIIDGILDTLEEAYDVPPEPEAPT